MHSSVHTPQSVLLTSARKQGQSTLVQHLRSPWKQVQLVFRHLVCITAVFMLELYPANHGLLQIKYQQYAFWSASAACKRSSPQQSHATLQLDQQTEPSSSSGKEVQSNLRPHRPVLWLC